MRGHEKGYGLRATGYGLVGAALVGCLLSACATAPARPAAAPGATASTTDADGAAEELTIDGDDDGSDASDPESASNTSDAECPRNMVVVIKSDSGRRYCVDKYEASLVEVLPDGTERPFPHFAAVDGHDVRAVSQPNVFPQGFISEVQAEDACIASGKRLCTHDEWKTACMGPSHTTFPYGDARKPGACHDTGKSAVGAVFGAKALAASTPVSAPPPAPVARSAAPSANNASHASHAKSAKSGKRAHATKGRAASTVKSRATATASAGTKSSPTTKTASGTKSSAKKEAPHTRRTGKISTRPAAVEASVWTRLNDPALGQVDGALAKTGDHDQCVNGFGVFDMVGNIHEWVATDRSAPHGTFAGGYYLDTALNGDGCNYKTQAHAHEYHDYSTGFRCCADASPPHAP